MSESVRPHRWQPTRLLCPWDSPGKNTGVGCYFLLQSMKVKSESEVAQSCPTLSDPMDCSLPGSSIHGIFQARVLEWGAIAFSDSAWYLALKSQIPFCLVKVAVPQSLCQICDLLGGKTVPLGVRFFTLKTLLLFFSFTCVWPPEGTHQGIAIIGLHIGEDAVLLTLSPWTENGMTSMGLLRLIPSGNMWKACSSSPGAVSPILWSRAVETCPGFSCTSDRAERYPVCWTPRPVLLPLLTRGH